MTDIARVRREGMRWNLLNMLYKAHPYSTGEQFTGDVMRDIYPDSTPPEIRRELDYLADRGLIKLTKSPAGQWFAELNRYGVDIVEYTIECDPGIARPPKVWG